MSFINLSRRSLLKAGAATLAASTLPFGIARAQTAVVLGIVYVGPKDDFGWNQAHAVSVETLKALPGITVVETYDIKEDSVRCAELIATGTNRYPDLGAWISVGGWPVFTANALVPVPPTTKFISFDTNPPAPDLLRAGKVQVLLGQKYFGWGSESIRLLAEIKAGRMPANPIIDSGVDVVTTENLDVYLAEWKRMEGGGN